MGRIASIFLLMFLVILGVIALIVLLSVIRYFNLWMQAKLSGAPVGFPQILMMQMRKVDPTTVIYNRIRAKKAGLDLPADNLENHYLVGGNLRRVTDAAIATHRTDRELNWDQLCASDLAGGDPRRIAEALALAEEHGIALTWNDAFALDAAGDDPREAVRVEAKRSEL